MKKEYTGFRKLNRLLVASFEAEKLYYNAAQDAQTTELKRFLNYMAVERNRMSHNISNELHSRDIEPLKDDAEKGNIDRTWHEIKEALESFDATIILNQCIARDVNNVERYNELLIEASLPQEIINILQKQKQQLIWYINQAEQHKKDPFKSEPATRDEALGNVPRSEDTNEKEETKKVIEFKSKRAI